MPHSPAALTASLRITLSVPGCARQPASALTCLLPATTPAPAFASTSKSPPRARHGYDQRPACDADHRPARPSPLHPRPPHPPPPRPPPPPQPPPPPRP